jgi:tetratricopeptide (TPR) repeat protein
MAAPEDSRAFVSYSRTDSQFVLKLVRSLRTQSARVWFDQLDIPPGARWDDEVEAAMRECNQMLVVLSPDSVSSQNVLDEVSYAIEERKQIIPVLHRACEVPFRLRRFQWVDLTGKNYNAELQRLVSRLAGASSERAGEAPQPGGVGTRSLRPRPVSELPGGGSTGRRAAGCAERAFASELGGQWREAEEQFRECFRHSVSEREIILMLDALRGIARALRQQEQFEEAEEVALLSWEIAEGNDLPQAAARAINTLAVMRYAQEDLQGARDLYLQALERARDAGDDELIALVSQNLGVIAHIFGDLSEARILYLEAMGAVVRGKQLDRAVAMYINLGKVCTDLGEWQDAELYFARGIETAERSNDTPMLLRVMVNRVELLIQVGELQLAAWALDEIETPLQELDDRELLTMAARFRGELARRYGKYEDAARHLQRALDLSLKAQLDYERARVLRAIAELRQEEGRTAAARSALREARYLLENMGAQREIARLDTLLQSWSSPSTAGSPGT